MNELAVTERSERKRLSVLFGIDPRTLALTRIATAVALIYNLATRYGEIGVWYSDMGALPRADVARSWGDGSWIWSLHMLSGSVPYQTTLFGVGAVCALLLLAGLFARAATIASWVLLLSLHNRAPALVTGGDVLLLMLLFWGMFLPWGQRASLDAWRRGRPSGAEPVLSVATAALLVQVAFMYFFTGLSKCNDLWFAGQALESVFRNPLFARPLGAWFAQFPRFLQWLTYGTLVLELVGPLLLFSPWRTRTVRAGVLSGFFLLHLGIEATMYVVVFSQASWAALTAFVPDRCWSRRPTGYLSRLLSRRRTRPVPPSPLAPKRWASFVHLIASVLCGLALLYVLTINPWCYFGGPARAAQVPRLLVRVEEVFGLGQRWDMFARPSVHNYRYVAVAQLNNGNRVDILRDRPFVGNERPEQLSVDAPSQRWVQLMVDLARPNRQLFCESVTRYLTRQWNARHEVAEQVESVELALIWQEPAAAGGEGGIRERVLARHEPRARGEYRNGQRHGLWTHYYPNGLKEAEGRYENGKEHGEWTFWYDDGRLQGRGTYADGRMHGSWIFCYAAGEKVEAFFKQGALVPKPIPDETSGAVGKAPPIGTGVQREPGLPGTLMRTQWQD